MKVWILRRFGIVFLVALVAFPVSTGSASAADSKEIWSGPVTTEVLAEGKTPEEARREAESRAKAEAIERVAGTRIYYQALVQDGSDLKETLAVETQAWVKDVRDVRHEVIVNQQATTGHPPVPRYRVTLDALVVVDPKDTQQIPLRIDLNRNIFEEGDEMEISIEAGQDCYIHVFNVLSDDKVTVLLPNRHDMVRFLRKGKASCYPPKDGSSACPRLAVFLPKGVRSAREKILVVATKEDVDLVGKAFGEADFKEYPTQTGLLKDLVPRWMEIPSSHRAVKFTEYEIRKKRSEIRPSIPSEPSR